MSSRFYTSNVVCLQITCSEEKNICYVTFTKFKHVSLYKSIEVHTSVNIYRG